MAALRGVLVAGHPAAAVVDRCSPCCHTNAAEGAPFLVCPDCGLWLLRCPSCRGAVAPSGWCIACLDLRVEWPERVELDVGGSCDLPVDILLASASRVELHRLVLRSGPSEVVVPLRGAALHGGGRAAAMAHLSFPAHGDFSLRAQLEFSWSLGGRLHAAALGPNLVRVRPPRQGHVVNISGTGNLVTGGSGAGILGIGDERPPQGVSPHRATVALAPAGSDADAFVSWRTRLLVPDLLEGGAPVELVQVLEKGVTLGRNRPADAVEPLAGPVEAALRFPAHFESARESSQGISRRHWRLFASSGSWWVEQLGQRPTTIRTLGKPNLSLLQGQRAELLVGSQLVVHGEGRTQPLVLVLRHRETAGSHVLCSELVLAHGGST